MPEIQPFAAVRFDLSRLGGDLSTVIAPPYDVLDQADKDALVHKSDRNIVALDLPHIPPKTAGPAAVYDQSAQQLRQWLSDGTLIRENAPALYLYHQRFTHEGEDYTRRMFVARVRLVPFSNGSVLPHEQTFGGPKADRLALMKATRCQLSAILGMYRDEQDRIGSAFAQTASRPPDATGELDGVENLLWIVSDRGAIDTVVSAMTDKKVYIADGHHRYGTALMYREHLQDQHGGSLPEDHPANYIMFVLACMDDPGCVILPYHRALSGINTAQLLDRWADGVVRCACDEADVVLCDGATGDEMPVRFTNRGVLSTLEPDECEAWRRLDYAYLHRYLIDELLGRETDSSQGAPQVHYAKSAEKAKAAAKDDSGVALLMKATPMEILRSVSEAGGLMPAKSTYFFPKLATGLTINPLEG